MVPPNGRPGDVAERQTAPEAEEANPFEAALWAELCTAPEQGSDMAELMRATGMGRSTIYRYLGQLADKGRAIQVGWGRWRAVLGDGDDDE